MPVGDPWEILEFLVLGNAISGILRQSQRVLISRFLKLKFLIFALKYNRAAQKKIYMLFASREVRVAKNCDRGLENAARGRWPREAFSRPRSQFFAIRTDP